MTEQGKLLSSIKKQNDALFLTYRGLNCLFFAPMSCTCITLYFMLIFLFFFIFLDTGSSAFVFIHDKTFQSNSAMILSVQIICIFSITLNNDADGIFLSRIYFVRFHFAEHLHAWRRCFYSRDEKGSQYSTVYI